MNTLPSPTKLISNNLFSLFNIFILKAEVLQGYEWQYFWQGRKRHHGEALGRIRKISISAWGVFADFSPDVEKTTLRTCHFKSSNYFCNPRVMSDITFFFPMQTTDSQVPISGDYCSFISRTGGENEVGNNGQKEPQTEKRESSRIFEEQFCLYRFNYLMLQCKWAFP